MQNPISKVINGNRYWLSDKAGKKLKTFINGQWIYFGDPKYEHYFDRTGLLDKSLNHLDKKRRAGYRARASKIVNGNGSLTVNDINSPNYHSFHILW